MRATIVLAMIAGLLAGVAVAGNVPNPLRTSDQSGTLGTYSTNGAIDITNPFFQSLGTNGRTCNSCHVSSTAWTISPPEVQARFKASNGTDPIFRPVDGANCPSADVSTVAARKRAYSQLLSKGLIRISIPVPTASDYRITGVSDPYNCAETTANRPAMYRRPLPSTNLTFLTTVMWDGREGSGASLNDHLAQQAMDATFGHAQAAQAPTAAQLAAIVKFETALYTAQFNDANAGSLTAAGATGGPLNLSTQNFYLGINDVLGGDPHGEAFNPSALTVYDAWQNSPSASRASVARGEQLFNTFPIPITGVGGLNDVLGQQTVMGTCTTCHDTPNVGNHSLPMPLNIGIADYPGRPGLDVSGLPVYTIQCNAGGPLIQTTDPGKALLSGNCTDIGKTKGPVLRGLAARAPYFHNGSAATLRDAVDFYDSRFNLGLTEQQKEDLVAFLKTL